MKFPIQMQRKLLDLQKIDIQIAKANHFLSTMPIDKEIEENSEKLFKINQLQVLAKTKISETLTKIETVNKDIETIENRIKRQQERAESAQYSLKEIQAILGEIEQMNKRKTVLENNEIQLLEENNGYEEKLEKILLTKTKLERVQENLQASKAEKAAVFIADKEELEKERIEVTKEIDPQLLAVYDKVKAVTGGIAAVAMRGNSVEGMSLEFSIAELDEIRKKPLDEVIFSQDHDYILVRLEH